MLNNISIVFAVYVALCIGYSHADASVGECVTCDSSVDVNCAQNPGNIEPKKCSSQVDSCYSRVVNGNTYRGCFGDLDDGIQKSCLNDTAGLYCYVCENVNGVKGCNNEIFPFRRLTCHYCSGNLNSKCFNAQDTHPLPCKLYNVDDKCYIHKTAKTIERGCLSDTMKCNNATHCNICNAEGCNNIAGSSSLIPTAPSSAAYLASTAFIVFATVLISIKVIP